MTRNLTQIYGLDDVCNAGSTTTFLQPGFLNGLLARANSTTTPGIVVDQANITAASAGSCSMRLNNTEFINYKFNTSVFFAGAVMSWPPGVAFNGMANSTLTGGYVTSSGLGNFIFGTSLSVFSSGPVAIAANNASNKFFGLDASPATANTTTTLRINQTVARTQDMQDVTDTFVYRASTDTLTNKTIVGANNSISGLLHGTQVDNPSSAVHGVTGSVVGTTDSQALTNKDLTAATNTFPAKLRQSSKDLYIALFRNAGTQAFPGQSTTSGYQPPANIHLTRLVVGGNISVALVATSVTITLYKGNEAAGNIAFQVTQSIAALGEFRAITSAIVNAGKDAILTTEDFHIRAALPAGINTITDFYAIAEFTYDN